MAGIVLSTKAFPTAKECFQAWALQGRGGRQPERSRGAYSCNGRAGGRQRGEGLNPCACDRGCARCRLVLSCGQNPQACTRHSSGRANRLYRDLFGDPSGCKIHWTPFRHSIQPIAPLDSLRTPKSAAPDDRQMPSAVLRFSLGTPGSERPFVASHSDSEPNSNRSAQRWLGVSAPGCTDPSVRDHRELYKMQNCAIRHVKRTHPSTRLMAQASQERLQPAFKVVFPIQRRAYHGRPSESRPPMNH
jgi:hypothetical protein